MANKQTEGRKINFRLSKKGIFIGIALTIGLFLAEIYLNNYFAQREKKEQQQEQLAKNLAALSEEKKEALATIFSENDEPIKPSDLLRDDKTYTIVSSDDGRVDISPSGNIQNDNKQLQKGKTEADKLVVNVDLHKSGTGAAALGMSDNEVLAAQLLIFNQMIDANKKNKGRRIAFIYGKKEEVLKRTLPAELKQKYPKVAYRLISSPEHEYETVVVTIP